MARLFGTRTVRCTSLVVLFSAWDVQRTEIGRAHV